MLLTLPFLLLYAPPVEPTETPTPPHNKKSPLERWRLTTLSNQTVMAATVVIAFAAILNLGVAALQWNEMTNAGKQTDTMLSRVQEQIVAANRLADAAKEANTNAVNAERPWIGPVEARVEGGSIKPGVIQAHLSVVNAGRTPAKVFRFRGAEQVFAHFPQSPPYITSTPFADNSIVIAIHNLGKETTFPFVLTEKDYGEVLSRKKRLYIYGIVEYEDVRVKGVRHTTKMCFYWTLTAGNVFASCPEYNDVD